MVGNPFTGRNRAGSFRTSKLDAAIDAWKSKWREFTTEIIANQHL